MQYKPHAYQTSNKHLVLTVLRRAATSALCFNLIFALFFIKNSKMLIQAKLNCTYFRNSTIFRSSGSRISVPRKEAMKAHVIDTRITWVSIFKKLDTCNWIPTWFGCQLSALSWLPLRCWKALQTFSLQRNYLKTFLIPTFVLDTITLVWFTNYSPNYFLNCTPLGLITI